MHQKRRALYCIGDRFYGGIFLLLLTFIYPCTHVDLYIARVYNALYSLGSLICDAHASQQLDRWPSYTTFDAYNKQSSNRDQDVFGWSFTCEKKILVLTE